MQAIEQTTAFYRRQVEDIYRKVRQGGAGEETWSAWTSDRNHLFATHPQSPIEDRSQFTGLAYSPYDNLPPAGGRPDLLVTGALAGLMDFLSLGGEGLTFAGYLNYLFMWGTVHSLGYAWADSRIRGVTQRLVASAAGLAATAALVFWGPYPVAMVGLDTAQVTNSYPPRVTLAFLGLFQAGLVLLAEPLLSRAMANVRAWTAVVVVGARIMTLYLWHLTAMVIVIGLSLLLGGWGLGLQPLTAEWWLTRPVWFVAVAIPTLGLMAIFGRYERPETDLRPAPAWWRPVLAVMLICAGLGLLAAIGIADEDGLNGLVLSLPIIGVVLGGVAHVPWEPRTEVSPPAAPPPRSS